jgi:Mn-dependent DtxR family transcriptional regulator
MASACAGQEPPMNQEHRDELIQLIKGAPQPEVDVATIARRMGVGEDEAQSMVDELVREGSLEVDGDRLIVVERSADRPGDEAVG